MELRSLTAVAFLICIVFLQRLPWLDITEIFNAILAVYNGWRIVLQQWDEVETIYLKVELSVPRAAKQLPSPCLSIKKRIPAW
jgi:hypothetical protein